MFSDFVNEKRAKATKKGGLSVPADILERWQNRMVLRGLDRQGENGAVQYLLDYGKGISTSKVVHLALAAEIKGCPGAAHGFWKKAYKMETGREPEVGGCHADTVLIDEAAQVPAEAYPGILPGHLQPGKLVTMQPVDAPLGPLAYVDDPVYFGQPKRDGSRLVIIADRWKTTPICYQSRSLKLREAPSLEVHQSLEAARAAIGEFVLDGELYYPDFAGKEHRTGAQAATANANLGHPQHPVYPVYAIFKALYLQQDGDLTGKMEEHRICAGEYVGTWLMNHKRQFFEIVPTAVTGVEKMRLLSQQMREGREGEVWIRGDCQYTGGKTTNAYPMVRTKHLTEFEAQVIGFTASSVPDRPFGALEIAMNGTPVGEVGTGFTIEEMHRIVQRYHAGSAKILVRSQGFTETGRVWQGRFVDFA